MCSRESVKAELKEYCYNKLQSIEEILNTTTSFTFAPITKLRLTTKQSILKHLVDYETYFYFASIDELARYIEDSADIICGFYEH